MEVYGLFMEQSLWDKQQPPQQQLKQQPVASLLGDSCCYGGGDDDDACFTAGMAAITEMQGRNVLRDVRTTRLLCICLQSFVFACLPPPLLHMLYDI